MKPQPTKPTTISTLCLRAADVIREKGWHQGGLCNRETGAVCAMGALLIAAGVNLTAPSGTYDADLFSRADRAVDRYLKQRGPHWNSVVNFNDAFGRQAEHVIQLLEDVAWEHAREGEFARAAA